MRLKRKNGTGKNIGSKFLVFLVVLALGLFSSIYYVKAQMEDVVDSDIFYPGVLVEEVNLEGMTYQEAEQAIRGKLDAEINQYSLALTYGNQVWEFGSNDLHVNTDLADVLHEAYSIGRSGALVQRYSTIRSLEKNPKSFDVSINFSVDELRSQIDSIAKEINLEPVDAKVEFHPQGNDKFTITDEKEGLLLNVDKVMADIKNAFESKTGVELVLRPEKVSPKVFAEELALQTKKIASFNTVVTGSDSRKSNVYHAAAQFDGMVVNPGEVVSFNMTTGERTTANGYKEAPVIAADKSLQDDLGGGVCQTSTTLYNAVVRAGLNIEERLHHSFPSTYAEIGQDATVNWPNVDFKFSNDKVTPVYIHTYRSGNKLFIDIYGKESQEFDDIKLVSDLYAQIKAPAANVVKDTNHKYVIYTDQKFTKVQSRPGYKVKTWQVYYKDGQEVRREMISDDYYKPITGTIYVGTKERTGVSGTDAAKAD
jgi:vancomycin resistance protein YoaR